MVPLFLLVALKRTRLDRVRDRSGANSLGTRVVGVVARVLRGWFWLLQRRRPVPLGDDRDQFVDLPLLIFVSRLVGDN